MALREGIWVTALAMAVLFACGGASTSSMASASGGSRANSGGTSSSGAASGGAASGAASGGGNTGGSSAGSADPGGAGESSGGRAGGAGAAGSGEVGSSSSASAGAGDGGASSGGVSGSGSCSMDVDCVACGYGAPPISPSDCYCVSCATKVASTAQCEQNHAAYLAVCPNGQPLLCGGGACVKPPTPGCMGGLCVAKSDP